MMKILIISGSHSRHLYVHKKVMECGAECAALVMERESVIPVCPSDVCSQDKHLFKRHFEERLAAESEAYGNLNVVDVFKDIPHKICRPNDLNSQENADFARSIEADLAIIFGPDIIKAPLLGALPEISINMHLGLSPWYRGSATLFWPFYFLQPQFAGITFHQITPKADAGPILHQP